MTTPRTAADFLELVRPYVGSLPPREESFVCNYCNGPVSDWAVCRSCASVFHNAPPQLRDKVVPASAGLDPGPWYTRLWTYKRSAPRYIPQVAAVLFSFYRARTEMVLSKLGGSLDLVTIVPSTRGIAWENQPLREVVAMGKEFAERLERTLVPPLERIARMRYEPDAFRVLPVARGRRILLIEDAWFSGANAISAAGALLNDGAAEVVILPIARMVSESWWPADHPYLKAMKAPYLR